MFKLFCIFLTITLITICKAEPDENESDLTTVLDDAVDYLKFIYTQIVDWFNNDNEKSDTGLNIDVQHDEPSDDVKAVNNDSGKRSNPGEETTTTPSKNVQIVTSTTETIQQITSTTPKEQDSSENLIEYGDNNK